MYRLILIALAGALGCLARYWLGGWVARHFGESFPTGTLVVNLLGCFLIGLLYHVMEERLLVDPVIRTAILIGFLGAFTTFSSYSLQTLTLLRDGELLLAGTYVAVSNLAGLALVWCGYQSAKLLLDGLS
jgi:CrcB protein